MSRAGTEYVSIKFGNLGGDVMNVADKEIVRDVNGLVEDRTDTLLYV